MHDHGGRSGHSTKEEQVALLTYMVAHNASHTEEIHDMAHGLDGEAASLIHEAVELYESGTDKLAKALDILKGE